MSGGLPAAALQPSATGASEVQHVRVGLWWPAADPGKLMAAAGAWRALAGDLGQIEAAASGAVRRACAQNQGQGIDAFAAYWGSRWDGSNGSFQQVAQAALAMADALEKYAHAVEEARRRIEELIAAAATAVVIGVALTVLTVGFSDLLAGDIAAGLVAVAAAVGCTLTEEVAAILTGAFFATSFGGLDGGLTDLAVQGERVVHFRDQQSISWSEVAINTGIGAATSAATVGLGTGVEAASPALRRIEAGPKAASPATNRLDLGGAAAAAARNGIDMRMFELRYQPGDATYGFIRQDGGGALIRGSTGRFVVTLQDPGLASTMDAVQTIAHELNHVRGILRTGAVTDEAMAEAAAQAVAPFVR